MHNFIGPSCSGHPDQSSVMITYGTTLSSAGDASSQAIAAPAEAGRSTPCKSSILSVVALISIKLG